MPFSSEPEDQFDLASDVIRHALYSLYFSTQIIFNLSFVNPQLSPAYI